jgi:hypothetical protein
VSDAKNVGISAVPDAKDKENFRDGVGI